MSKKIESLYIHVPFCKHLCNYCDFYKKKPTEIDGFAHYEKLLDDSWNVHQEFILKNNFTIDQLETLYLGGGTPSLWGKRGILFLKEFLKKNNLSFKDDYEFSIEIDPAAISIEELDMWQEIGVNRFSVGLQTWDKEYLKIIDRIHTLEQADKVLTYLKQKDVNYTVDFMLGFPKPIDRERDIIKELSEILKYSPKHISLYILSVNKGYPLYKKLPDDERVSREYLQVSEFLGSQGFDHYEVSNHGLEGFRSQHNQKYWKQKSVAALGPSATGFLNLGDSSIRYKWKTSEASFVEEPLSLEQMNLEKLYTGLRTDWGVNYKELIDKKAWPLIEHWVSQSLAITDGDHLRLMPSGYVVLDNLIDQIFNAESSN